MSFDVRDVRLTLVLILLALGLFISGCSTLRQVAEKFEAPEKAAKLIDGYCEEVPYLARLETRSAVNALTVKGDIRVDCDGDPAE